MLLNNLLRYVRTRLYKHTSITMQSLNKTKNNYFQNYFFPKINKLYNRSSSRIQNISVNSKRDFTSNLGITICPDTSLSTETWQITTEWTPLQYWIIKYTWMIVWGKNYISYWTAFFIRITLPSYLMCVLEKHLTTLFVSGRTDHPQLWKLIEFFLILYQEKRLNYKST